MPREITDRARVVEAVKHLSLTAELFEEQNGKQKYGSDLEVIVQGRDYGNGKRVGPSALRLLRKLQTFGTSSEDCDDECEFVCLRC